MELKEILNKQTDNAVIVNEINNYFLNVLKMDEKSAILEYSVIAEYGDILNEFIEAVMEKTLDVKAPITVEGYTAKKIASLKNDFNYRDIYCLMSQLRHDPERTKMMLDLHETISRMTDNN